jgi:peptidoglycan-N-acetylglucosamine deacetylase
VAELAPSARSKNVACIPIKRIAGALAALVLLLGITWVGKEVSSSRSFQLAGELVTRVERVDSVVALTFDDGPTALHTDSVLAILSERDTPATFFMVGRAMERYPGVVARVLEQGHEIGNHSYSHRRLVLKLPDTIREEVQRTDALIRAAGQDQEAFVRPPYGSRLVGLPMYLSREERPVLLWDVEPDTYYSHADGMVDYMLEHTRPGSIILLHVEIPARQEGRVALRRVIPELRSRGYRFVTLSELVRGS